MNALDVIFLVLAAASVVYSLIRGLVREIFSFLAVILGFFGASYGYSSAAEWLKGWVRNETLAQILAFAVLFLLVALLVGFGGRLLSRVIRKGGIGWADRVGGAAFGFLKAVLLIAVALLALTAFLPPKSELLRESKVAPAALTIARGLSLLIPQKFYDIYAEKEKELKKYWTLRDLSPAKPDAKGLKKL